MRSTAGLIDLSRTRTMADVPMPQPGEAVAAGSINHCFIQVRDSGDAAAPAPVTEPKAAEAPAEAPRQNCTLQHAADFGFTIAKPEINWSKTLERKQDMVDKLVGGLSQLLKSRKVTVFDGHGRLHGGHKVSISGGESGDVTLSGDSVVIAVGSLPRTIPGFDVDGEIVMTSDEFLSMDPLPSSAVVIGGGAIGCEFASTMSDMGTDVTILEALPKILPGCEADVTRAVHQSFKKRNIDIKTGVAVTGHELKKGSGTTVSFGEGETIDVVVVSVGRRPNTDDLGLDDTKVQLSERGFVEVDELCRTSEPSVWSVGDCIATPALAHIAFAEGILVVKDTLGKDPLPLDYANVSWAIYCHPEVAFAGMSEEAAKEAGYDVVTSKHRWTDNGRARRRCLHPAAPDPERAVRRVGAGADGQKSPWLRNKCRSREPRSPIGAAPHRSTASTKPRGHRPWSPVARSLGLVCAVMEEQPAGRVGRNGGSTVSTC